MLNIISDISCVTSPETVYHLIFQTCVNLAFGQIQTPQVGIKLLITLRVEIADPIHDTISSINSSPYFETFDTKQSILSLFISFSYRLPVHGI